MKKWQIGVTYQGYVTLEVEAETAFEAEQIAMDSYNDKDYDWEMSTETDNYGEIDEV